MHRSTPAVAVVSLIALIVANAFASKPQQLDCSSTVCIYIPAILGAQSTPIPTPTTTSLPTPTMTPLVTPTATLPLCPPLSNGNFEQGHTVWAEYASDNRAVLQNTNLAITPRSGTWLASFAGQLSDTTAISQTLVVPDYPGVRLVYYYQLFTNGPMSDGHLFQVFINKVQVSGMSMSIGRSKSEWTRWFAYLNDFRGQTVRLYMRATTTHIEPIPTLYLDDFGWSIPGQCTW
jgi:hypothetical protein